MIPCISTCDLSPDGNPEKYGRPMKSAIACIYNSFINPIQEISIFVA